MSRQNKIDLLNKLSKGAIMPSKNELKFLTADLKTLFTDTKVSFVDSNGNYIEDGKIYTAIEYKELYKHCIFVTF